MMLSVFIIALLAALLIAVRQNGKWRQRALAAEAQNRINRKAHEIQNDIVTDPALRERVRRHFDRP